MLVTGCCQLCLRTHNFYSVLFGLFSVYRRYLTITFSSSVVWSIALCVFHTDGQTDGQSESQCETCQVFRSVMQTAMIEFQVEGRATLSRLASLFFDCTV